MDNCLCMNDCFLTYMNCFMMFSHNDSQLSKSIYVHERLLYAKEQLHAWLIYMFCHVHEQLFPTYTEDNCTNGSYIYIYMFCNIHINGLR